MFNHFKEANPLVKCQERSYRRFLNKINIGFGKLGDEECEDCRAFSLKSNFPTAAEGDPKAPFSLASTSW